MVGMGVRLQLKEACYFLGGQKAVANAAGADNSNFGKWLAGSTTLSDAKVNVILDVMGLPGLKPDTSRIHVWYIKSPPGGSISNFDFADAASLYFPNGGKIAKAAWVKRSFETLKRMVLLRQPKSVYALTDGHCRAVLRLGTPMALQKGQVRPPFIWRDGEEEASILNISDIQEQWISGMLSLAEFDAVWEDKEAPLSKEDLMSVIRNEGITYQEAVRRILSNRKS